MYILRPANRRGHTQTDWLDSWHTFSFGQYFDPDYMGFGDLRVINDDTVAPGQGFGTHPHDNMEIISVILNGELEHKDSMGNGSVIKAGDIQKMSAGSGVSHSEFNPSPSKPVHFLQIWILPDMQDTKPSYVQKSFNPKVLTNQLTLIVSPDGRNDSIIIQQDAEIYQTFLEADKTTGFDVTANRKVWIQVAEGSITVNGQPLVAGDGIAIADENANIMLRGIDKLSNILVFNLKK